MREFITIVNGLPQEKKQLKEMLVPNILKEFMNDGSVSNVDEIVSQLEHYLGEKLHKFGPPSRVYDVDGGSRGVIYVIGDGATAVGLAWPNRSSGVRSLYVWYKFSLFRPADFCFDLPKVDFSLIAATMAKLIMNPVVGKVQITEAYNETRAKLTEANRTTEAQFVQYVRQWAAKNNRDITKISYQPDMIDVAAEYDVQVPGDVRNNKRWKTNRPGLYNFSAAGGGQTGEMDDMQKAHDAITKLVGTEIAPSYVPGEGEEPDMEFDTALNLAKAKQLRRLIGQGKVYVTGRKNGRFFKFPVELFDQVLAMVERLLAQELADRGGDTGMTSMEEQYEELTEKVEHIASGRSTVIKSLLLTGSPSSGKALFIDTKIPTPDGWSTMEKLNIGDKVFDENGLLCNVIDITPVMINHDCYEVKFDDGTKILADAEHKWFTSTRASRNSERRYRNRIKKNGNVIKNRGKDQSEKRILPSVITTKQISETLGFNHMIEVSKPIIGSEDDLPIKPYVLGAWLGDGGSNSATLTCGKDDIAQLCSIFENEGQEFKISEPKKGGHFVVQLSHGQGGKYETKIRTKLRSLGVLNNKHIPTKYLRASEEDRLFLLQGLMDTDGFISKSGNCEFCVTNKQLAIDTRELLSSLGIKSGFTETNAKLNGIVTGKRYRIHFSTSKQIFKFSRKKIRINEHSKRKNQLNTRTIVSCNKIDSVPVKCISVDSPNNLFLCSESFIPTHNSHTVMNVVKKKLGLKSGTDYVYKKGGVTVPAMYRILIEQINGMAIFDDCDSVVKDADGLNILKGALETEKIRSVDYDKDGTVNTGVLPDEKVDEYGLRLSELLRQIRQPTLEDVEFFRPFVSSSYLKQTKSQNEEDDAIEMLQYREAKKKPEEGEEESGELSDLDEPITLSNRQAKIIEYVKKNLPNKINFKGVIIFISNMTEDEFASQGKGSGSAILSRSFYMNLSFGSGEMLNFIEKIYKKIDFESLTDEEKKETLDYIRARFSIGSIKGDINFRFVMGAFESRVMGKNGGNWKRQINNM